MEEYTVYRMIYNGEAKFMAISKNAIDIPEDFFPYGSTDLKEFGNLEISGTADAYLNESFEL